MDPSSFYARPVVMEEDFDDDDIRFRPARRYFPDTYLDSPIMITVRSKWIARLLAGAPEHGETQFERTVRDLERVLPDPLEYQILDPEDYPSFYHTDWQTSITDELTDAITTAQDIYGRVSEGVSSLSGSGIPSIPGPLSNEALYWATRWSYFDSLVEEFSKISADGGPNVCRITLGDHTKVVASKDMWFLRNSIHGKFMLLYDQVLMAKDVMFSRYQTYVAIQAIHASDPELTVATSRLCEWHEKCLIRYGNAGFEVLKQTEALSKAYLSAMSDKVFGDDGPYPRMMDKVIEKERKLGCTDNFLTNQFDSVLRSCTKLQTVVELFGLLKVSGHPLVDARKGGKSAAHEARSADSTLFTDAARLDWEFKRVMLESYIAKYGSWPSIRFDKAGETTVLHSLYKAQRRGLHRTSYPLEDWQHCRFGQIVEFDYSPNYLELLDDKSISLYRSNVAATWRNEVKPISQRRLLMELIRRGTFNVKEIVMMIVKREVPFDWFIVSLHPKEREFKIEARMFSMLVLEIRVFFALTEANLADKIFPFLPQQTMTKSKIAINRQFLEITKPHTATHALRMFLEIDLSRWNLRWRAMSVNPVAHTLNDMFGVVGIFDFTHEFFSKCMILVRVQELEPEGITEQYPPESDLVWYNHLGGFEGICQKLWTICTYSMISIAVSPLPISYILIGQADNQILSITTSRDRSKTDYATLAALRDDLTTRIAQTCASVNQEVKVEECLESTSVITYSKDIYVNGVYRPTSLKFHNRLFPHSSQIFPSVRTNLGSIFATAVAGAEKSDKPMTSYYLACLHGATYLYRLAKGRGPYGKQLKTCAKLLGTRFPDFVKFMLTLPSEAGGFPVLPFIGFTYKGGSDPLSKSLSAMTVLGLKTNDRLFNRMLSQMHQDALYAKEPKTATLLMDPYSIPVVKPATAVDGVANETLTALIPSIRTVELKELMSANTTKYLDKLVEALGACRPLNPVIIRDILDCSVAGITETVRKMFVATRTLQNVVRDLGVPVVDRVLHLESAGIAYMFNRFTMMPNDIAPIMSTYDLTVKCRKRWYPGQECPIVGLTTYQPSDLVLHWGSTSLNIEGINSVLVTDSDPLETRGSYDPYVGSKTREKRSEHGYKIIGTDTASKAMRKLQLIASQTGDDPHFKTLIDAVGWSRTNTTLSEVSDLLPGISGGTLAHRYAARTGHQDAFNIGSPNFATHIVISTDNMGKMSGGIYDYPFMVQEHVLYLNWMLQNRYSQVPSSFLAGTLATDADSMDPLPSVSIRGPDVIDMPIARYPTNPLAFLPSLHLQRVSGAISHPALNMSDHYTPSESLRRHALEAYFKALLRRSSTGRQIADGSSQHFATGTLDIAEVYSNGLRRICQALAYVVCDEAIANYMMTDLQRVKRWKLQVYSTRLVMELTKAISPSVGHPLLSKDPLVRQLRLHDCPMYTGSESAVHHKMCAYINGLVLNCLCAADKYYNHRSLGIFSSDNSRTLSESILTSLLHDLYIWRVQGLLPSNVMTQVLGKKLIPAVRAHKEEQDKVDTLIRTIAKLARMTSLSSPSVSEILVSYQRGRFLGYRTSVEEVLKATRQIDTWGIPTQESPLSNRRLKLPNNMPKHRHISYKGCDSYMIGFRQLLHNKSDPHDLLANMLHRNKGRCGLMSGSAIHVWSLFSPLLAKRPVIVVGSGHGAVGRVALDGGCPFVYGIDLRSTLPMRSHRFRHYKPPLIMTSRFEDQYYQVPESFTTSGDWTDPRVAEAVLAYDQGDSTLVIDIQKGSHRYGLELLTEAVLRRKRHGVILLRLYLSSHESDLIAADLSASGCTFKMYDIWRTADIGQVVILLQKWDPVLKMAVIADISTVITPLYPTLDLDVSPDEKAMAVSEAVFDVVYVAANQTVGDIEIAVDRLLDSTWGDHDSRFNYTEWTRWLRAKVVTTWLLLPEGHQQALHDWLDHGSVEIVTSDGRKAEVKVDWSLAYHLASVAARVL